MRRLLLALALSVAACKNGHPPPHAHATMNAAPTAPARAAAPAQQSAVNVVQPPAERNRAPDPVPADLSPAQRRAYELGYRDCSQGRYAPANHLEAYRIGCAAAHNH